MDEIDQAVTEAIELITQAFIAELKDRDHDVIEILEITVGVAKRLQTIIDNG